MAKFNYFCLIGIMRYYTPTATKQKKWGKQPLKKQKI